MKELHEIQKNLHVGKQNRNDFGKYNYRSCSDILEELKKVMPEGCFVTLSDDIQMIGERYYIKATATLTNSDGKSISVTAWARESFDKKGMDDSQITGSASSYARKYALNGLFSIDDTKDADSMDNTAHQTKDKSDIEYTSIVEKNLDSLVCIRDALKQEDYSTAKEAWNELDEQTKLALWKAPRNGGWFTTREREQMKSNEWAAAF